MYLIAEISESDIFGSSHTSPEKWELRKAVRGIVVRSDGLIPILHATTDGYYKLPGGGVEMDEDLEESLRREIIEEVGSSVSRLTPLGCIIEYKEKSEKMQISYIYTGVTDDPSVAPEYTEQEIKDGLTLLWTTPTEALRLIEGATPSSYIGRFIQRRESEILKYYLSTHLS